MKSKFFNRPAILAGIIFGAVAAMLLSLPTPKARADSQGYPTTYSTPTNMPSAISATNPAVASGLNGFIPLKQGRGAALMVRYNASTTLSNASGNATLAITLAPSVDGTNPITTGTWTWTLPTSGTTDIYASTNWYRGQLDGYAGLFVLGWNNTGTNGYITNKLTLANVPNY